MRNGNDSEQRLKTIVNNVVIIFHNARAVLRPLPVNEGLQVEETETTEPAAPRKIFKTCVKKTIICFKCHGQGHFARECPSVGHVIKNFSGGGRKRSCRK